TTFVKKSNCFEFSGRTALRIIAALTERSILSRILRPLHLAADPPPIAEARLEQGRFAWPST
ncbi:MAG: hypothetical protein OEU26_35670, partial [Candidatus Tectomicrobia bacterium]|nr:hypothetical protein [Candidatus Tectomicrobia bacterium]